MLQIGGGHDYAQISSSGADKCPGSNPRWRVEALSASERQNKSNSRPCDACCASIISTLAPVPRRQLGRRHLDRASAAEILPGALEEPDDRLCQRDNAGPTRLRQDVCFLGQDHCRNLVGSAPLFARLGLLLLLLLASCSRPSSPFPLMVLCVPRSLSSVPPDAGASPGRG